MKGYEAIFIYRPSLNEEERTKLTEKIEKTISENGILHETNYWGRILEKFSAVEDEILYMLGEEDFRDPIFESTASIFGEFDGENIKGIIGVVGPKRMYYDLIVPQVRYFSGLLEQILKDQKL